MTTRQKTLYRGRFAPSPTGPLHFGSLVTAVGSYLDAKAHQGEWLVRIEDLDPLREVPGAARDILTLLEKMGMYWDSNVVYQSQRHAYYREALSILVKQGLTYNCTCSRKEIADSSVIGIDGPFYPGTCRNAKKHRQLTSSPKKQPAVRIKTGDQSVGLNDPVQGVIVQHIGNDIGDFVLHRADGVFAYQLAVVVDDAEQAITHIVRGADLLNSTPRQIFLQNLLSYATPAYMHLPIVTNAKGEKLSKQTLATPVEQNNVLCQLFAALKFLGQNPPDELRDCNLDSFWQWAVTHWNPANTTAAGGKRPDFIT